MVVYLHESLNKRLASGKPVRHEDIEEAIIEGAVHRLRPKLMTVCVVLASLVPILWESGIGSDVMKPIAAPLVGGMITSTIHVLILVPVFFALMKERALRRGTLQPVVRGGLNTETNQRLAVGAIPVTESFNPQKFELKGAIKMKNGRNKLQYFTNAHRCHRRICAAPNLLRACWPILCAVPRTWPRTKRQQTAPGCV